MRYAAAVTLYAMMAREQIRTDITRQHSITSTSRITNAGMSRIITPNELSVE